MENDRARLNEIHCHEKEEIIEKYEMKIIDLRKHLFFEKEETAKAIKQQGPGISIISMRILTIFNFFFHICDGYKNFLASKV